MNVGFSPAANATSSVAFQGAAKFAPVSKPDIAETIDKFKNSELGQNLIKKAKDYISKIMKTLSEEGGFQKLVNMAKEKFNQMGGMDTIKKGAKFVKDTFKKIADNPTVKKIATAIKDAIKNTKPQAA